ncbi:MAG: hypothetical protein VKS61_12600 [Candidatus Sericytochromatia bacterium]|nr:hypothetical protein [Candidatus Sericytochromatia bacterium]
MRLATGLLFLAASLAVCLPPPAGAAPGSAAAARAATSRELPAVATTLAYDLLTWAEANPTHGRLAVQPFTLGDSRQPGPYGARLEREVRLAIGRLGSEVVTLDPGGAGPMRLEGIYDLIEGELAVRVTARVVDARRQRVVWTSPAYAVAAHEGSALRPRLAATPAPVAAATTAPTPTPAATPTPRPTRSLSVQQKVGKPRVMVILPETHIQRPVPDPAAETELVRVLVEAGFKLVDPGQSRKIRENEQQFQALRGDLVKLATIGREYGAEVVIIGEAFSHAAGGGPGGQHVQARVEARAVRCDTGEILVAHGLEATAVEASEFVAAKKALRLAGQDVASYFAKQLAARWGAEASGVRSLEVLVSDLPYTKLVALRGKLLSGLPGVQAVHQRHYEDQLARFEVDYEGDPQDLVELLVGEPATGLELVKQTAGKIELRVR